MHRLQPRHLLVLLVACALPLVGACGGSGAAPTGGSVGTPAPSGLTITTASLPGGASGSPYAPTQLQAVNVAGAATWSLDSGMLPPGLGLSAAGVVSGTPTVTGSFDFVVRVVDAVDADTQSLVVAIDILGVSATSGLTAGDGWTNRPVTIATSGQTGLVTFSASLNGSGGSFTAQDGAQGTATWTPGTTGGPGVVDALRVTASGGAQTAELRLGVRPNPVDTHTASFGTTDVWYIDASPKMGTHGFASDFHKALADAGLRDPQSTGAAGTPADQIAELWIRIEILRQLNLMFLRNADGTPGAQGMAITFPFEEPGTGYAKPAPGSSLAGAPTRYSVLALVRGSVSGVIGTAFLDGASNGAHENDTTAGSFELGVFTNQIVPIVNSSYGNSLAGDPVDADDLGALKALLYEQPGGEGRFGTIRYVGRGLARTLAAVIAHEAGHSLGLDHTEPPQGGSIMNPAAVIGPSANYSFSAADTATLQSILPGTGKVSGSQTAQKTGVATPPGGVRVCQCRACAAPRAATVR